MIPRQRLDEGYDISRIIKGGWHLAGDHGSIDRTQALADMAAFVEAGITTFDCADIYTGVEQMIGDFRRAYPDHAELIQIHTKFVPDLADLPCVDETYVARIVDRSLQRLGVDQIDVVQFHWWDYATPRYVDVALELDRQRRAGKIARIGATNFDVAHLAAIIDAGVPIATHQVQYSLLDRRPQNGMVAYCQSQQIALLCYGTVAGGFLSERWLGQPEPAGSLTNRSLVKYKLIIDDFGGWEAFQDLLRTLSRIAAKHGVDIASIATAAILNRPCVAAAIVGATNTGHLASHAQIGGLKLEPMDIQALDAVTLGAPGPVGDVYTLERDRHGPHGRIMKYELNKV
jgi:aryl-alcohol dehydrogenase-like predicted oxidoreductase